MPGVLEYLKNSLGFEVFCVPPDVGAKTHASFVLNRGLAILKPLRVGGSSMLKIEAGADEGMMASGASWGQLC